jgi:hypothetical protein
MFLPLKISVFERKLDKVTQKGFLGLSKKAVTGVF